jgi:hypothetical protein
MADSVIPDDISQFVIEKIESVAQLEALLLLRHNSDSDWSVQTLAARLYISEEQTAGVLALLSAQGIVSADFQDRSLYRYRPNSPELKSRLAEIYAKHLVPVTNLIHSKPKSRIQEFADAFRLRKDT